MDPLPDLPAPPWAYNNPSLHWPPVGQGVQAHNPALSWKPKPPKLFPNGVGAAPPRPQNLSFDASGPPLKFSGQSFTTTLPGAEQRAAANQSIANRNQQLEASIAQRTAANNEAARQAYRGRVEAAIAPNHQPQVAHDAPAPAPAAGAPKGKVGTPMPAFHPQGPTYMAQQMQAPAQHQGDWMHPMQREGLNQFHSAINATNSAIAQEMQSRVDQAREWDQRMHEENLAAMKYQADMANAQAQMQAQSQHQQAKDAKNSALWRAAGMGGTTIVNGRPFDPFRNALIG